MKKILSAVFFLFVFSVTPSSAEQIDVDSIKNPITIDAKSLVVGKKLYVDKCSDCHGVKADGNGPAKGSFEMEPWSFIDDTADGVSDGYLFQQIKNGGPWYEMPPFGLLFRDVEIWSIVGFLRSLRSDSAS